MLGKIIIIFSVIISPLLVQASESCLLNEALKDPTIANNPQFWEDYAKINSSKLSSEKEIELLVAKYKLSLKATTKPTAEFNPSRKVNIQHKAEKEIQHLPKNLHQKLDEFISTATGPHGLKDLLDNPGRWHYEKLPQFGSKAHSVRLNDGYRVLFDVTDDGIEIRRVNKGQIHGN